MYGEAPIWGISGAIIFFLLTHLAMLTYYKKYDYWWHYYCDLGSTIPENLKSMLLYNAGITYFAITMLLVWINIGSYLTLNVRLIQVMGIVGCISVILMIVFPYEKSRKQHISSVFSAFISFSAALMIANQELQLALLNLYFLGFIVYISVVTVATAMYRKEMKKAHKYQVPLQKTFVLLFNITVIVFCMTLASL